MQLNTQKESIVMAVALIPCYGGELDGTYFKENACPDGYRILLVRGKSIFVYSRMKVERLDFSVLEKAAKTKPSSFDFQDPEK